MKSVQLIMLHSQSHQQQKMSNHKRRNQKQFTIKISAEIGLLTVHELKSKQQIFCILKNFEVVERHPVTRLNIW
jgi:hypothetical protein